MSALGDRPRARCGPVTMVADLAAEVDALEADRDEVRRDLERLHSWAGLMELLDEHWPESIFPTTRDREDRDAGARIVSLLRWVDDLRADERAQSKVLEKAKAERDAARRELDELRQRVEGALGPARMMDRAEACQTLNAVRAALDPAPPHQDAHAGCGDRLTDRGDVGPCIAVGPHDQHDDGHGITWTRSTV